MLQTANGLSVATFDTDDGLAALVLDRASQRTFSCDGLTAEVIVFCMEPRDEESLRRFAMQHPYASEPVITEMVDHLVRSGLVGDGTFVELGNGALQKVLTEVESRGWWQAADYMSLTYCYPFVFGERPNGVEAHERMTKYAEGVADIDRGFALDIDAEHTRLDRFLATDCASRATSRSENLLRLLAHSLCETGQIPAPWTDVPLSRRTSPSGGARHPVNGYLLVKRWEGLKSGLYNVVARPPALQRLRDSDVPDDAWIRELPDMHSRTAHPIDAVIVLTVSFARNMYRYHDPRTYRSVYLDAGHVGGTIELLAEQYELSATAHYATDLRRLSRTLGVSDPLSEEVAMVVAIGSPENPVS